MQGKFIRTPGGINLGEAIPIHGKRGLRIKQGKKEEDVLPETLVEYITGKKVMKIVFEEPCPNLSEH